MGELRSLILISYFVVIKHLSSDNGVVGGYIVNHSSKRVSQKSKK